MHRVTLGILGPIIGFTVVACQGGTETGQPPLEDDLAAIAEAREALVEALANDDLPGIMAAVTDDHITMPPNGSTPVDNAALAEWHRARIDQFEFQFNFTSEVVQVRGDVALEHWSSTWTLVPREAGEPVEDSGKGVWIWERQADGSWKLLWSIWNSNLETPPSVFSPEPMPN